MHFYPSCRAIPVHPGSDFKGLSNPFNEISLVAASINRMRLCGAGCLGWLARVAGLAGLAGLAGWVGQGD